MKKVVFIVNLSCNPNSIKRINEFHSRGYEVEAYGFDRELRVDNKPCDVDMQIIGRFPNSLSYRKRLPIIYAGIKDVINKEKGKNCFFYLIGLEVAMCFLYLSRSNYVYEEADMVHANLNNRLLKDMLEFVDKRIIKKSIVSVFRSEGFLNYHYGNNVPANVHVIPNKLDPAIEKLPFVKIRTLNIQYLKIGFVGLIRYKSIFHFALTFCRYFPQCEFHFFGAFSGEKDEKLFSPLKECRNCFFHGEFSNPKDLPHIYSQIDMVLSTYDVDKENVRYAESNKLYEAIYFETPIIVSSNTYLAEKVKQMGIGYTIDAMNDNDIVTLISQLTEKDLQEKTGNTKKIDKCDIVNINDSFFIKLESLI